MKLQFVIISLTIKLMVISLGKVFQLCIPCQVVFCKWKVKQLIVMFPARPTLFSVAQRMEGAGADPGFCARGSRILWARSKFGILINYS